MRILKHSRGVTLVELMATLSAAAVALTLGFPSFRGLQADMQRTQVRYALTASFTLARSEAARRGVPVTVCPSLDGITCSPDSGLDWSRGWIVKINHGGEPKVLDAARFRNDSFAVAADGEIARGVTFKSSGVPSATGAFLYRDDKATCQLRLSPLGRIEVLATNPACS
jgi:type IV fimbrial biogenesis protein FimT